MYGCRPNPWSFSEAEDDRITNTSELFGSPIVTSVASRRSLWKPRPDNFLRIETLPYLGTGKLDLRRLRELAFELTGASK